MGEPLLLSSLASSSPVEFCSTTCLSSTCSTVLSTTTSLTTRDPGELSAVRVTGMNNKWNTEETGMKELVYTTPVATAIVASYMGDYGGGVYNDPRCCEQISDSGCKNKVNHE